ncbi:MAG: trypsin-like peptidase domain-containing protein [Thiobacillus sp.]|nr:trypsin-like peptidase domain-containing protein [Thiobacillus sp.]
MDELAGQPTDSSAVSQAQTPKNNDQVERTYSFFFDQGDHLKELMKTGQYEAASQLFRKYQTDFFDKKRDKYAPLLDSLAASLNDLFQPRFDSANAALIRQAGSGISAWPAARKAISKARQELEAFAPHEALVTGKRRSPSRDSLSENLRETEAAWNTFANKAFEDYDLKQNFFTAYPVVPQSPSTFLAENYVSIEGRLRAGGVAAVREFSKAYQVELAPVSPTTDVQPLSTASTSLLNKLGHLYVELVMASNPGKDRLKTALTAVAEAQKEGLIPTEVPGLTIAFVEATSQTLLKEGQINFPVAIDVDLPFKTVKTTLDEALSANTPYDYVLALEVSMAKSQQRAQSREQISSQFLSGHRQIPNPGYEPARMAMYQAQSAVSSNNAQYCNGYGCLGKAIAGIALAVRLKSANEVFGQTPMTLTEPVYQDYQFSASDMVVRKAVTTNYYVVDTRRRNYFKSVFDMGEEKHFRLAYNLNAKDKSLDTHLKQYDKEDNAKRFDEAPVTVRLSGVLAQYMAKGDDNKPFKSLIALRDEMLVDKNKALTEYRTRERNQTATTQEDPRFDSVVVILNPKGSLGTGFFVEPDLVLTNYHVVEGTQFVEMKMRNGLETFGKVIKSDVRLDLALIRAQARGQPVRFHSGAIPLGATVEAIGHPKGLEFSITRGIVSALRKQPSLFGVGGKEVLFVQTDTPINPGNSGGPLFLNNQVVAVNDNKFSAKGIEGIAFSIHYTEVQDFLKEGF